MSMVKGNRYVVSDLARTVSVLLTLMLCFESSETFAEVFVSGIGGPIKDNVLLTLSIEKEKCDAPTWKIQGAFENADQEIDQALRALGYYHAVVNKSLGINKRCWRASFDINQGQRVVVSDVNIVINGDASSDPDFIALLKKLPLKKGSPLHHGQYENMKSQIESLAMENGYLHNKFTEKKLLINKQNNTAQIKLAFDTGKRLVFGDVSLQQNVLDTEFVKKYLSIKTGDFYTSEQLAKTHNALAQSGYFETVDIRADLEHAQHQRVPITIKLSAKKKAHYGFGIGYDTDVGPLLDLLRCIANK